MMISKNTFCSPESGEAVGQDECETEKKSSNPRPMQDSKVVSKTTLVEQSEEIAGEAAEKMEQYEF